ncbi:hypothetical protein Tco_0717875 [Tanacetum coccineum]
MSENKQMKKFLTSLPRRFHIVANLAHVLDLRETRFEDVVRRLKAYEERVKEEDKANDAQEKLLYARTDNSNRNHDSSRGRGRGLYSRGRGQGRGQGRPHRYILRKGLKVLTKNNDSSGGRGRDSYSRGRDQRRGREEYTPPKIEFNTEEDDVWYFNNDDSNHMTDPETKIDIETPYEKLKDNKKKQGKDNEAKMTLYNALLRKEYEIVFMCKTTKDVWHTLIITHQGNSQVKDCKVDLLTQQYEKFLISDEETINSVFTRFNAIVTSLKSLDQDYSSKNHEQTSDDNDSKKGSDEDVHKDEAEAFNLMAINLRKFFRKGNRFGRGNQSSNGGNRFGRGRRNGFGNKGGGSSRQNRECNNSGEEGHFIGCKMGEVDIDALAMEQYLALSRGNQAPGVVKLAIGNNVNFKMKSKFMRELRENTFLGNKNHGAHEHVEKVLDIVSLFNIQGLTHDAVMLYVFPITLTKVAKRWFEWIPSGLINTWGLLEKAFI